MGIVWWTRQTAAQIKFHFRFLTLYKQLYFYKQPVRSQDSSIHSSFISLSTTLIDSTDSRLTGKTQGKNWPTVLGPLRQSEDEPGTWRYRASHASCDMGKKSEVQKGKPQPHYYWSMMRNGLPGNPCCWPSCSKMEVKYNLYLSCWIILREMAKESQYRILNSHWYYVYKINSSHRRS